MLNWPKQVLQQGQSLLVQWLPLAPLPYLEPLMSGFLDQLDLVVVVEEVQQETLMLEKSVAVRRLTCANVLVIWHSVSYAVK